MVVLIFASKSFPLLVKSNFGTPDNAHASAAASVPHRRSEVVLLPHSSSPPPPEGWEAGGGGGADDDDILLILLFFLFSFFSRGGRWRGSLFAFFVFRALGVALRWAGVVFFFPSSVLHPIYFTQFVLSVRGHVEINVGIIMNVGVQWATAETGIA